MDYLKRSLVGKPLKSAEDDEYKLARSATLALLSSGALSSVAYGTKQVVAVLVALSVATIWYSLPTVTSITILSIPLTLSYRQIIHAYPHGSGTYTVSSESFGENVGLVSGGSLSVDYMLTIAASVPAGAETITSAIPALYGRQVVTSVTIVLLLMMLNLRGLRESAPFLLFPVYTFILVTSLLIAVGLYNIAIGATSLQATALPGAVIPGISIALILQVLSSGFSSLAGVEAINNAVPFFKKPRVKNTAATLAVMALVLGSFFVEITFANHWYGIIPEKEATVLFQIGKAVFGHGILYYILQSAAMLILAVTTSTGLSTFPAPAHNLAKDKFIPHMYQDRGDRLDYSNEIITLALGSVVLLFIFHGSTERLIPLCSIGVFIPFASSQTGMVVKWKKEGERWSSKSTANTTGAFTSYAVTAILFVYRLGDIWLFFVIMPIAMLIFYEIHDHYKEVAEQLRLENDAKLHDYDGNAVLALIRNVTRMNISALNYAHSVGGYVIAIHVLLDEDVEKEKEIEAEFKKHFPDVCFSIVHSPHRSIRSPIIRYVGIVSKNAAE